MREAQQRMGPIEVYVQSVSARDLAREHPLHHTGALESGPTLFRVRMLNHSERMISVKFYGTAPTTQVDVRPVLAQATRPSSPGPTTRTRPTHGRARASQPTTMPIGARDEQAWLEADGRTVCLVDGRSLAVALARAVAPHQKLAATLRGPPFQKRVQAAWRARWQISQLLPGYPEEGLLIFGPLERRPEKLVLHLVAGGMHFTFPFSVAPSRSTARSTN